MGTISPLWRKPGCQDRLPAVGTAPVSTFVPHLNEQNRRFNSSSGKVYEEGKALLRIPAFRVPASAGVFSAAKDSTGVASGTFFCSTI